MTAPIPIPLFKNKKIGLPIQTAWRAKLNETNEKDWRILPRNRSNGNHRSAGRDVSILRVQNFEGVGILKHTGAYGCV